MTAADSSFLEGKQLLLEHLPGWEDSLKPFSTAYVKGWRRSVACLIAVEGLKRLAIPMETVSLDYKAWLKICEAA